MRASRQLQAEVVRYARALHQRGWVANHDGNVTARVAGDRFLATPTATSKADVDDKNLLELDSKGERVAGRGRRFGEIGLHLAVYRARPDVSAVIHAHPPSATALACSGQNLIEVPFIAEAVVSIGPRIPLIPFAAPGAGDAEALAPQLGEVDVALLGSHGVLAWGSSVELAYLRLELCEHLARIALAAQPVGGVKPLPAEAMEALLRKRAGAGLGTAADRAVELWRGGSPATAPSQPRKKVAACAPAPHANVEVTPVVRSKAEKSVIASADPQVQRIIREEIVKILSDS